MPLVDLDDLLRCLQVERVPAGHDPLGPSGPVAAGDRSGGAPQTATTWTARNLSMDYRRVFGGQVVAQAVAAATADANAVREARAAAGSGGGDGAPPMVVKSIQCLFPREGDADRPLRLTVEPVQDGRTFAARRVSAAHDGKAFFVANVSLHVPEPGLDHQDEPPGVGPPDEAVAMELGMIPWECRVADGVDLTARKAAPANFELWTRVPGEPLAAAVPDHAEPTGQWLHQALLGHATDLTLIGTALRPHEGWSQADAHSRLATAVTSHSMWFHRPVRMDEWTLIAQRSPSMAQGRGFGWGHVFGAGGDLVASFAQESLIRVVPDAPDREVADG